ncbi:hypothetical protein PCE1_003732 [Barthelona sp. PCE]
MGRKKQNIVKEPVLPTVPSWFGFENEDDEKKYLSKKDLQVLYSIMIAQGFGPGLTAKTCNFVDFFSGPTAACMVGIHAPKNLTVLSKDVEEVQAILKKGNESSEEKSGEIEHRMESVGEEIKDDVVAPSFATYIEVQEEKTPKSRKSKKKKKKIGNEKFLNETVVDDVPIFSLTSPEKESTNKKKRKQPKVEEDVPLLVVKSN